MCSDGEVRLVGEETGREGQVKMCYNGVGGTVCADGWNEIAANITYMLDTETVIMIVSS